MEIMSPAEVAKKKTVEDQFCRVGFVRAQPRATKQWMKSMVFGRYNELVNGDYNGL